MSLRGTRTEREQWQQMLASKCIDSHFIGENFSWLLRNDGKPVEPTSFSAEVVRAKATDRMTIRYRHDGDRAIYAKAYYDANFACLAYRWLRLLWESDFGSLSKEQVPEPLGYLPQQKMLLMREVHGAPVSEFILTGSLDQAKRLMQLSARWLAKFHAAVVPDLQIQTLWESMEILKTVDLLAKVAAACPERTSQLLDLVHQWKEVTLAINFPTKLAPVHGQFRPAHVFVQRDTVVAIDLDKLALSDPAKDVARFIHVMTKTCIESDGDLSRVAGLADEFMSSYESYSPGNLGNLHYYMALYALKELSKVWKKRRLDATSRVAVSELHLTRFQKWAQSSSASPSAA